MKTKAVIRIVVLSIVLAVLLGLLCCGLAIRKHFERRDPEVRWEASANNDHEPSIRSEAQTAPTQIRKIEINWVSGTIMVQYGDVEQITYQETAVSDSRYRMVTEISGDELEIEYCSEDIAISFFGINDNAIDLTKDLIVTVPRDAVLESIEIDAASAEVIIRDLAVGGLSLDTASGKCSLEGCDIGKLDVDTASGDIHFSGSLDVLDYDAASAKFTGILANAPRELKIDTMSGDIDITLPSGSGFSVSMDAMSGAFTSDFETVYRNGTHFHGDGACRISFSGMSGDIIIRKGA